ncbi:hypothetical protein PI23P_12332 [Polaribacter irgensii 23-P]|uniref:Uncharacterized protein n=1 Tax=Polaribacter irgensii 23-P TaxID=313594 RepID=A4C1W9_9FLAO|nr:hypothetical protein [Polaribacter irgensii]EAR12122.1 hypothetical protein PI23P_12332 [Polaribacter irgensii 23-P]
MSLVYISYDNDVAFKKAVKEALGITVYAKNDGTILEVATTISANVYWFF